MSYTPQLDVKGYCAIYYSGSWIYIPMLAGSTITDPVNLRKVLMASNASFEAINYAQGLSAPILLINTLGFPSWFNPTFLTSALNSRDATSGLMPSLGSVAFRYGSGAGGDLTGLLPACKVGAMTIAASGIGDPVSIFMMLLPFDTGATPEAFSAPASTYGQPFMGQACDFYSSGVTAQLLSHVEGFSLTFSNGMTPVKTMPPATYSAGAKIFPIDYRNGPLDYTIGIMQELGADLVIENQADMRSMFTGCFRMKDPSAGNEVLITTSMPNPSRAGTVKMGPASLMRTYFNLPASSGSTSLAITAS